MGTRADFYIGRGESAEWLGSIAFDGYPDGVPEPLLGCASEKEFRDAVQTVASENDHFTRPEQGWPWPWEDSGTTDYSYAYDDARVYVTCFGHGWITGSKWLQAQGTDEAEELFGSDEKLPFPNMKDRQNVTFGQRSGVILLRLPEDP